MGLCSRRSRRAAGVGRRAQMDFAQPALESEKDPEAQQAWAIARTGYPGERAAGRWIVAARLVVARERCRRLAWCLARGS
jgi:hypothetical protein